ncbi:MAG: nucleotidyltransferase [Lachnospiraceae bacterium]|nr:nucleotidyltransferase [Lachnospiraceae bacterium]
MKIAGIIVEYNPFHNGHKLHIEETRKITGADYIIAIMSGNFVQRGEPAIIDKYCRCEMALLNGVDLVIELPTIYATASAEYFAFGAVSLLNSLNIVDFICFGSEIGDCKLLDYTADILSTNNDAYQKMLNTFIKQGNSYPKARELALTSYLKSINSPYLKDVKKLIASPNNILGIEYIKALKKLNSTIKPVTITRTDSGYNAVELDLSSNFSSASSIRNTLTNNGTSNTTNSKSTTKYIKQIKAYIPSNCYKIFIKNYNVTFPITYDDFSILAYYKLLNNNTTDLNTYVDIDTVIANKLLNNFTSSKNITTLLNNSKSKDVTYTRLSRALLNIILNNKKDTFNRYLLKGSTYARILGFKSSSSNLIKTLKKSSSIPLINKLSLGIKSLSDDDKAILEMDIKSSELYNKIVYTKFKTQNTNEYKKGVIIQ